MGKEDKFFRASVGIMVVNADRRILVLRRADVDETAWQMPQGGIRQDEEPEAAMWRELAEETGLGKDDFRLKERTRNWLVYELPEEHQSAKVGLGQAQRWYLCEFAGRDAEIAPDGVEFDAWRWVTPEELVAGAVPFRKSLYASLIDEFADYLS